MPRTRDHLIMLYESKTPIVKIVEVALGSPDVLEFED